MLSDDLTETAITGASKTRSILGGIVKGALIGAGIALAIGAAVVAAPGIGAGVAAIAAGHGLLAGSGLMLGALWHGIAAAACGVAALVMGGTGGTAATAPAVMGAGAAVGAAVMGIASVIPGVKEMMSRHRAAARARAVQQNAIEQARAQEPLQVEVPSRPVVVRQAAPSVIVQESPPVQTVVTTQPDNPEFQPGRGMQMMQKGDAAQSTICKT